MSDGDTSTMDEEMTGAVEVHSLPEQISQSSDWLATNKPVKRHLGQAIALSWAIFQAKASAQEPRMR